MITAEQLVQAGIFPEADAQDCLWVESGIGWLKVHTTLPLRQRSVGIYISAGKIRDNSRAFISTCWFRFVS